MTHATCLRTAAHAAPLLLALLLPAAPAAALINVNYTPVDLVYQSDYIARVQVGPVPERGPMPLKVLEVLQGEVPEGLTLVPDRQDERAIRDIAAAIGDRTVTGTLMGGDFVDAEMGASGDTGDRPTAVLHVGLTWFGLTPAGGETTLTVGLDQYQLSAVWAGGDAMLVRAIRYILADPRADVPVRVGASYARDIVVGTVEGPVHDLHAVDLAGDGTLALVALAASGDRLFVRDGDAWTDATAARGLATASRVAAWGDLDGAGRLDLASWGEKGLLLATQAPDGTFTATPMGVDLETRCLSLEAVSFDGAAMALVAGTARGPVVVLRKGDGWAARAAPGAAEDATTEALGEAGPCVLVFADEDRRWDVLQPMATGVRVFKGIEGGTFGPGVKAADTGFRRGASGAAAGDFDADGLVDLAVVSEVGPYLFWNRGDGTFEEVLEEAGEVSYNAKPNVAGVAVGDINNDGRLDLAHAYRPQAPQLFFNRGFRCFGFAIEMQVRNTGFDTAGPIGRGQQALAVADLTGDGAQDLAVVTNDGRVVVLARTTEGCPVLGVTVAAGQGPAVVTGTDGKHALGARVARPGRPVLLGKRTKGPLTVAWRTPHGTGSKQVIVLKPERLAVPGPENPTP